MLKLAVFNSMKYSFNKKTWVLYMATADSLNKKNKKQFFHATVDMTIINN